MLQKLYKYCMEPVSMAEGFAQGVAVSLGAVGLVGLCGFVYWCWNSF